MNTVLTTKWFMNLVFFYIANNILRDFWKPQKTSKYIPSLPRHKMQTGVNRIQCNNAGLDRNQLSEASYRWNPANYDLLVTNEFSALIWKSTDDFIRNDTEIVKKQFGFFD